MASHSLLRAERGVLSTSYATLQAATYRGESLQAGAEADEGGGTATKLLAKT